MLRRSIVIGALGCLAVAGGLSVIRPSSASDHADSPRVVQDKQTDITDVYAFMRPEPNGSGGYLPSTHAVLVMNTRPGAADGEAFSESVDYIFEIRRATSFADGGAPQLGTVISKIICNFNRGAGAATEQFVNCNANGLFRLQEVGVVDLPDAGERDLRIFAGRRSDPAFFDRAAFDKTASAGALQFAATGTNTYANANVLSLVVEVNVSKFLDQNDASPITEPVLTVVAETYRRW